MSKKLTAADKRQDKCIACPYDPLHRLMPERFALHLIRCAKNHPGSKMVRCPFNNTHLFSSDTLQHHVESCPDRAYFVRYTTPDKLPLPGPSTGKFFVESAEDWDAEPPAPTYNPEDHCRESFVIRNPQGASPSARRQFREQERRRFIENNKF
ncbi:hypothetical protein KR026_006027 [Drosophila bipectinata]|nr:hypothetical protein KR026_006027 [Drosophila bipectinata]